MSPIYDFLALGVWNDLCVRAAPCTIRSVLTQEKKRTKKEDSCIRGFPPVASFYIWTAIEDIGNGGERGRSKGRGAAVIRSLPKKGKSRRKEETRRSQTGLRRRKDEDIKKLLPNLQLPPPSLQLYTPFSRPFLSSFPFSRQEESPYTE